jgi:two-component system, NtrC family, response regulator
VADKILLVEDEKKLRRILQLVLSDAGYEVQTAADGGSGVECWKNWQPSLVLTDLKMEPLDGLHVLRYGCNHAPDIPCVMLTAFGTVETAVEAMKNGAFDFLTKPVDHGQLLEVVKQGLDTGKITQKQTADLLGSSAVMQELREEIRLLASTDSAVLILGESGTGKELVARGIHKASKRNQGPFIRLNCASIPAELLESELFGHTKGSFTGATENREGAFMRADGGILFLDEIGDLPLSLQPKLLHAVEEKEILPIGGKQPQSVSVKILSATNLDLTEMIKEKTFRMDLYYRLNIMQVVLPPLSVRENDVEELAKEFLRFFAKEFGRPILQLSGKALQILRAYSWPGNVRELRNVMERAVLKCSGKELTPDCIPSLTCVGKSSTKETVPNLDLVAKEQELLLTALKQHNWNKTQAAKELNISRSALRYRLNKYGIGNS